MTRWLVTGAGGLLGRDLVEVLSAQVEVTAADRARLDITDPDVVAAAVAGHDVVINAAAWTDVDAVEAAEPAATAVNGHAMAGLARACEVTGARLIQISTDYVFSGDAHTPYAEDAPTDPINAYGRGKLVGERAVRELLPQAGYVVRTAWLYGSHGGNFVATMLRLARERDTVDVVDDQRGQPTWTRALAAQLATLGGKGGTRRRPTRDLPRHRIRRDHLVRPCPGGVRRGRPRPRPGPPDQERAVPATSPPTGLQRAWAQPVGGRWPAVPTALVGATRRRARQDSRCDRGGVRAEVWQVRVHDRAVVTIRVRGGSAGRRRIDAEGQVVSGLATWRTACTIGWTAQWWRPRSVSTSETSMRTSAGCRIRQVACLSYTELVLSWMVRYRCGVPASADGVNRGLRA